MSADLMRISNTMGKMEYHLANHKCIVVGVSGGSDSNIIVHIIATYFRKYLDKVKFCFQNTGLEYKATLDHLDYMENRYGIKIDRVRGESVVSVVRREGIPIISKDYTQQIDGVMRGIPSVIKKYHRTKQDSPYALSLKQKSLGRYIIANKIKVSDKCCNLSKKKPFNAYLKQVGADLRISG